MRDYMVDFCGPVDISGYYVLYYRIDGPLCILLLDMATFR